MLELGGCQVAASRCPAMLRIELAGELAPEIAGSVAQEVWMLADASDAPVIALDFRRLRRWLPPGQLATLAAFRPRPLRRKAWCQLVNDDQLPRAERLRQAYRSSGDDLEVFTSERAAALWVAACNF